MMDLQLGLALPNNPNKRSFSQLFQHSSRDVLLPTTLPLLPLTPSSHQHHDHHTTSSIITTKNDGDDDDDDGDLGVVGWPPLISQRKKKKQLHYEEEEEDHNRGGSSNAVYVKVKMEGEGIGRKVDLSLHHSFQKLKQTLLPMFGKCDAQHSNCYELAYQDKEGDWMLAEDVSWRNFTECAQRLKLLKNSGRLQWQQ